MIFKFSHKIINTSKALSKEYKIVQCTSLYSPFRRNFSFSSLSPLKLTEITKIDKLKNEKPDIITGIWEEYHKNNNSAHALTISKDLHAQLNEISTRW